MSRPLKKGVDYFPLDCRFDDEIKYIEAEFGLDGFAMIIKLWQKIYANEGYYCSFTRTVRLMFAGEIHKGVSFVDEVIKRCTEYGIFDRRLYTRYNVLTSSGIQKRYAKMTERHKSVTIDSRYLLISAPKNWVNADGNPINADNNSENVDNNSESKSKVKEKEITTTTTVGNARDKTSETEGVENSKDVENSDGTDAPDTRPPSYGEIVDFFKGDFYTDKYSDALVEAGKFQAYNANRHWDCLPDWRAAAELWASRISGYASINRKER